MAICLKVDQLRSDGLSKKDAVADVGRTHFLGEDAVSTIYQSYSPPSILAKEAIGEFSANPTDFVADLRHYFGDGVAQEFIDHLNKKKAI